MPTAGIATLLAGPSEVPEHNPCRADAILTAQNTWKHLVVAGQSKVEVPEHYFAVESGIESEAHMDSARGTSNHLILESSSDSAAPPLEPPLLIPKAERPVIELTGLRSETARVDPEMHGNRAVGELMKARPGDDWYSVRLVISGKKIKVRG